MIGEGVDIQRLRVLVYLPRARTDLRFRQAMGRVVRKYDFCHTDWRSHIDNVQSTPLQWNLEPLKDAASVRASLQRACRPELQGSVPNQCVIVCQR